MAIENVQSYSLFTDFDISLFSAGKHFKLYEKLGSTALEVEGKEGVYFAVWAPNAKEVAVIGTFNNWSRHAHRLMSRWDGSGIWEGFIPGVKPGDLYKYSIHAGHNKILEKGDPYAERWQTPPETASEVFKSSYKWNDSEWMKSRKEHNALDAPISVYEMHLGSWKRKNDGSNNSLSYREMADELIPYLLEMGFTHVEFMPVMEHPFFGSWGYQVTGYFAPSSRFGSPDDFAFLVDELHRNNIGVFLDWVPSHFPGDIHGLFHFDGTSLYEHSDYRLGYHPDWNSFIFNYGRNEVRAFLISNAMYWFDRFHIDGMRVDAVASMLYLDYSREEGAWIPNKYGGRENLEAISLLREMNEAVYRDFPDVQTIAEESTSWPMVSKPVSKGGLGFGMKWMMGWMNDMLKYFRREAIHRRFHQDQITFSMVYAFTENFMLPLSHDEVVHGKGSILSRMPGDEWQRFANMRTLYCWMFFHPGAKLLFMGNEFAQTGEWNHDHSLSWGLLDKKNHAGIQKLVIGLNTLYKSNPALYELNFDPNGFDWIDFGDSKNTIIAFYRKGYKPEDRLVIVGNFGVNAHRIYELGVDEQGSFEEIFNSDSEQYGGSGFVNGNLLETASFPKHRRENTLTMAVPPMGFSVLKIHRIEELD